MLDGFVVPHAHFRVFHGNAAAESTGKGSTDQIALLFEPRRAEAVPTDLHLREFAQLEAQAKALQQQQPTARLVGTAQTAALAECFSFYARLMTPESFTWPDFLSIVFGKLTEHFIASDADIVRKAILDVFRGARAHLARVSDAAKIATLVRGLLREDGDARSTVWALQLVEAMPSLVVDDDSIRASVLRSLAVEDATEKQVAVETAHAMLPLSSDFRKAVYAVVTASKSPMLVSLMPRAIEEGDRSAAEQAWNFSASLFHDQVKDADALNCLHAAGHIVAMHPEALLSRHLQLVRYVITKDPRPLVVSTVWSTCTDAVHCLKEGTLQTDFFDVVSLQLRSASTRDASVGAMRILSGFSASNGQVPVELVESARKVARSSSIHQRLFIQLLSNCAEGELTKTTKSLQQICDSQSLMYVNELIQYLSPRQFARDQRVWLAASGKLKTLSSRFSQQLGKHVGEGYLQLLEIAQHKSLGRMEAALWTSLSYIAPDCAEIIAGNPKLLSSNKILSFDAKTKQAVAVCLVAASRACGVEVEEELINQCLLLTHDSDNDRYTVARVAMCQGSSRLTTRLLAPIADSIDNDVFGSWIRALIAISDASIRVETDQLISVETLRRLEEGKALLETQGSAQSAFDFQVAFIGARVKWMELILCAQQYAGEILQTGRNGGAREYRLSEALRANAAEFAMIRSKMLCASDSDRDVLGYHARASLLVADAALRFFSLDVLASQTAQDPSILQSSARTSQHHHILSLLESDVQDKATRLKSIEKARQPLVGSTLFIQLLRVVCTLPLLVPRQFFRSRSRPADGLRCSMQFLTHAEATSTPSKPRTRSQLGVAVGTEFRSALHGVVVFPRQSTIHSSAYTIRITVSLAVEKTDVSNKNATTQKVHEVEMPLKSADLGVTDWTFAPIEAAVVVPSELLQTKGSYIIQATACMIDSNGNSWALAMTGGRRGIIVY